MILPRLAFLTALALAAAATPIALSAQKGSGSSYVVADNGTGHILQSANAQKKVQIGSLTKIATAMVVLDWSEAKKEDLNQLATVPASVVPLNTSNNGVGFHPGDQCSLRDLLYAALMQSDNQAAETLASHVGRAFVGNSQQPSVVAFVAQMNALARRLGMRNTRFLNAHGLDSMERSLPYSTAEDLALLTRYAMERPAFRFYVSQVDRRITFVNETGDTSYMLRNTNEALGQDQIDGVKTGATGRAGQCVIISAARAPESVQDGEKVIITPRRLNVVVLNSNDRFNMARNLLSSGWAAYDTWAAAGRPTKRSSR